MTASATSKTQLSSHVEPIASPSEDASLPEFTPMRWTINEIRAAIPKHLFERSAARSMPYFGRDLLMAFLAWRIALCIDPFFYTRMQEKSSMVTLGASVLRIACWMLYWWFQGLIFTGLWVIGHECGHGAFSDNTVVCHSTGFVVHTLLFTPYFSWKISHHRHHATHASMERDEVYVPITRSRLNIPPKGSTINYEEFFEDTPLHTLFMLVTQQLFGFWAYLTYNVSGQPHYPKWTNHFNPNAIIFNKTQRGAVIISDLSMLAMMIAARWACQTWGIVTVMKYYGIPWFFVSHWFVMITFLHHTDQVLPHYRQKQWSYARGAAATIDRDFLGWMGRFFLHDVAHYHVIHHFFPKMPWYHGEEATMHLRNLIGPHYHRSSKPAFQALWESYNNCQFVDDEGDVVFYRDKQGRALYRPSQGIN